MGDLFGAGRPSDFHARCKAVKAALDFGDVADALALSGSSRDGWDCPECGGEHTINERGGSDGGRCQSCGTGFDIVSLVQKAETLTFPEALTRLERIKRDLGGGDTRTGSLL